MRDKVVFLPAKNDKTVNSMPANKNAVTRYYIIDKMLANRYRNYSVADIRDLQYLL